MTAYSQYTPVGLPRYTFQERQVAAAAALNPGDFYEQADGLLGWYTGLEAAAIGDQVVFYVTGVYDGLCNATSDTYIAGAPVFFDTVTKTFKTTLAANGVFAGNAVVAKPTGSSTVTFALNSLQSVTATTAASWTVSGATALNGAATCGSTLTVTGLTTLSGELAVAANNTPVAAAGSTYANATAVGAQDIVTISSDTASKGVKLLTGVAGQVITLINTTATACKLYAATGGTLSGLAANAPVTIAASHIVRCHCTAADTWYVEDCGAVLAA